MTLSADEAELIKEAINHLRRLGIVGVQTRGIQAVVLWGHRCKICGSRWSVAETEAHQEGCILEGSNPNDA